MAELNMPVAGQRFHFRAGRRTRRALWGYFFIAPFMVDLALLWVAPIFFSGYYSFTRYTVLQPPRWIGLENYIGLVADDRLFWISVYNTVYYTALAVPLQLILAFVLALLLNANIRGQTAFRTMIYLPSVVPLVASAALWLFLLAPRVGLVNIVLMAMNIDPPAWWTEPLWAKPALILMSLWSVGGGMIIYLAGLQGIPEHLYEAAQLDGASRFRQLIHVTVPMMTPTIFYNLIIGLITSMQVFAQAYIMTNGGPLNATHFYMLKLYQHAFFHFKMGYASAMAWMLFVVILALTILVFKTSDRWVYYETGEQR